MTTPGSTPLALGDGASVDRNGLAVLTREESLALLARKRVGRIAVTMRATDPAELEHLTWLRLAPWGRAADLSHTIAIPIVHRAE